MKTYIEHSNLEIQNELLKLVIGKTITSFIANNHASIVTMLFSDGSALNLWHEQDCCEQVEVEEIIGEPIDLINSVLTMAHVEYSEPPYTIERRNDSQTWTFYKFASNNGYVTIRFLGSSNSSCGESVSLKIEDTNE